MQMRDRIIEDLRAELDNTNVWLSEAMKRGDRLQTSLNVCKEILRALAHHAGPILAALQLARAHTLGLDIMGIKRIESAYKAIEGIQREWDK